jgi:hypothetical protein
MTTYPTGVKKIEYDGPLQTMVRVPARDWPNFCTLSAAQTMVALLNSQTAIKNLSLTFGAPTVDPEQASDYTVRDPQQPVQMWTTQGTDNLGRVIIVDPLGSFIDRETYPSADEDVLNPDGTRGGKNIVVVDLGYTVELAWAGN